MLMRFPPKGNDDPYATLKFLFSHCERDLVSTSSSISIMASLVHIIVLLFYNSLLTLTLTNCESSSSSSNNSSEIFMKQFASRMLWMTHQRKFVLPKGTILQLTPKITVPMFRHAPYNGGFDSDIQASWTFYMKFDKLNMTSDDHPWPFDWFGPPFYPFGDMMRPNVGSSSGSSGDKDKDNKDKDNHKKEDKNKESIMHHHLYKPQPYPHFHTTPMFPNVKYHYVDPEDPDYRSTRTRTPSRRPRRRVRRKAKTVMSLPPPDSMFGGERATILPSLEGLISTLGLSGRDCLLRAVCEVHEYPLQGYGLFGEMVTLFFSISESPYAESHLPEYLRAEMQGRLKGDCEMYKDKCKKSIFMWEPRLTSNSI